MRDLKHKLYWVQMEKLCWIALAIMLLIDKRPTP